MAPKKINKEAKKHEILKSAMEVFARKGVGNTKMTDVAEAAGIGKGTIYEYYKNKDEIFADSFHHFMKVLDGTMAKRLFKITDPLDKLEQITMGWIDAMESHSHEFMEIMLDFWAEGVRHKDRIPVFDLNRIYVEFRALVSGILEDGINRGVIKPVKKDLFASILIGTIDGLMLQWVLDHKAFDLREAAEVVNETLVAGLKNVK